jgi:hypothetical protein
MIEMRPGLDGLAGPCFIAGAMKNIILPGASGGWCFIYGQMFGKNYL